MRRKPRHPGWSNLGRLTPPTGDDAAIVKQEPLHHGCARRTRIAAVADAYGRLITVRARRENGDREVAAKSVAAYLAGDDAEVYNLTAAAVQKNALTAALNVTALASEAVADLAATRGLEFPQILRALTTGQLDPANHGSDPEPAAQVIYPSSMDDYDWAMTETKGWVEITIQWATRRKTVTFYDPTRLAQEVQSAVTRSGYFAESAVVVLPAVTKEAIEAVIAQMAQRDFADID